MKPRSHESAAGLAAGVQATAALLSTGYVTDDPTDVNAIARAANLFCFLEAERWADREPNGDFRADRHDAIDAAQAPLLDLLCETPAADRPDIQAARVKCYRASDNFYGAESIGAVSLRLSEAIMRDIEAHDS